MRVPEVRSGVPAAGCVRGGTVSTRRRIATRNSVTVAPAERLSSVGAA